MDSPVKRTRERADKLHRLPVPQVLTVLKEATRPVSVSQQSPGGVQVRCIFLLGPNKSVQRTSPTSLRVLLDNLKSLSVSRDGWDGMSLRMLI